MTPKFQKISEVKGRDLETIQNMVDQRGKSSWTKEGSPTDSSEKIKFIDGDDKNQGNTNP